MSRKRSHLFLIIIISFLAWVVCPWSNSSLAAKSYYSTHAVHGHAAGHEEEDHHASKGYDHSCINPISYSKEDISFRFDKSHSSVAASLISSTLELETCVYDVSITQSHLISAYPSGFFIPLYQIYSVYRL